MTEEIKPAQPQEEKKGYAIGYDSHRQEEMIIKVPLKEIAENPDIFMANCVFIGFFEQAKNQAGMLIQAHRDARKKGGIIQPKSALSVH